MNELGDFGEVYDTDRDEFIGQIYTLEKLNKTDGYWKLVSETRGSEYRSYKILDICENILLVQWG